MKKLIFVFVLSFLSFNSFADGEGAYFSLGGGAMTMEDYGGNIQTKQVLGRLGYDLTEYFGVGFEGGFSLIEDEVYGADLGISTTFMYLRFSLPFGDGNKFYAMIGPTNVEVTASVDDVSVSADDDDVGKGLGFQFAADDDAALFLDYLSYYSDDGVRAESFNFGYTSYF